MMRETLFVRALEGTPTAANGGREPASRGPRPQTSCPMLLASPSAFAYPPELAAEKRLLPSGSVIYARYFGGLYALRGFP